MFVFWPFLPDRVGPAENQHRPLLLVAYSLSRA